MVLNGDLRTMPVGMIWYLVSSIDPCQKQWMALYGILPFMQASGYDWTLLPQDVEFTFFLLFRWGTKHKHPPPTPSLSSTFFPPPPYIILRAPPPLPPPPGSSSSHQSSSPPPPPPPPPPLCPLLLPPTPIPPPGSSSSHPQSSSSSPLPPSHPPSFLRPSRLFPSSSIHPFVKCKNISQLRYQMKACQMSYADATAAQYRQAYVWSSGSWNSLWSLLEQDIYLLKLITWTLKSIKVLFPADFVWRVCRKF